MTAAALPPSWRPKQRKPSASAVHNSVSRSHRPILGLVASEPGSLGRYGGTLSAAGSAAGRGGARHQAPGSGQIGSRSASGRPVLSVPPSRKQLDRSLSSCLSVLLFRKPWRPWFELRLGWIMRATALLPRPPLETLPLCAQQMWKRSCRWATPCHTTGHRGPAGPKGP